MVVVIKIAICVVMAVAEVTSLKESRYVNLAYKRTTSQSGEKMDANIEDWGSSLRAVDGNDNPIFEGQSCTRTNKTMNPFWRVQVGGHGRPLNVPIRYVMITNRNSASWHLNNFAVNVLEYRSDKRHVCYHFKGKFPPGTRLLKCKEGTPAGSVLEIKILRNKKEFLTLCEVAVFRENPGWYKPGTEEIESPVDVDYRGRPCASDSGKYCSMQANGEKLDKPKCFVAKALQACTIPPYFDDFEYTSEWSDWSPCSDACGHSTRRRQKVCEEPEFMGMPCPKHFPAEIETDVCKTRTCDSEGSGGDQASGVNVGQVTDTNSYPLLNHASPALGAAPPSTKLLSRRLHAAPPLPTEKTTYEGVLDVNEQDSDEGPPAAQANIGFIESARNSETEPVTVLAESNIQHRRTSVNEESGLSVSSVLAGFRVPGSLSTIQKVMVAMVSVTPVTLIVGLLGCILYFVDKGSRRKIPSTDGEQVGLLEGYPEDFDDKRKSFRHKRSSDNFNKSEFPSGDDLGRRTSKRGSKQSKRKSMISQQQDAVEEGEDELFDALEEFPLEEGENEGAGNEEVENEGKGLEEGEDNQDEIASNEAEDSVVVENQNARSRPSRRAVVNRNENSSSRAKIPVRSHESGARRNDVKGPLENLVDKVIQNAVLSEENKILREKRTTKHSVNQTKGKFSHNKYLIEEVSRPKRDLTTHKHQKKNMSEVTQSLKFPLDKNTDPRTRNKTISVSERHSGMRVRQKDDNKSAPNTPTTSSGNNKREDRLNNQEGLQSTSHMKYIREDARLTQGEADLKILDRHSENQQLRPQWPRVSPEESKPDKRRPQPREFDASTSREGVTQKRSEISELPLQAVQTNNGTRISPTKDTLPRRRKTPEKHKRKSPIKVRGRSKSKESGRHEIKRSPESASIQDLPGYGASAWIIDSKRTPSNDEKYSIPGYGHQNI